jgi:hypothetical protein
MARIAFAGTLDSGGSQRMISTRFLATCTIAFGVLTCARSQISRVDISHALTPDAIWFVNYSSDDTPAGDSAAAIASAAGTDLEGGARERGMRLFREALRRGVPDPDFYRDGIIIATMRRDTTLRRDVLTAARQRFPDANWPERD